MLLTINLRSCTITEWHSVLNVVALAGAFNWEKALVGAFPVIVKTDCKTDGSFYSTSVLALAK